jgi:LPXTG-site transpeptidase (sortase) family protein
MKSIRKSASGAFKASIFFVSVFAISFTVLYLLNFVPNELKDQDISVEPSAVVATTTINKKQYELPLRISIEKIGVNSVIQNPNTTNIYALDELLLKGVVRYPGSGVPAEGNMFLFGHSTGLKVVKNQAFKAFNNLKNLVAGDVISVYTEKNVYLYVVNNVKLVDSNNALVDFSVKKTMLTLSTCNTFGQKEERYVVEADYFESKPI